MFQKKNNILSSKRTNANASSIVYFFIPRHSVWNKKDNYWVNMYNSIDSETKEYCVMPFVKIGKTYRDLTTGETALQAAQYRGSSTGYPYKLYCVKVIDFGCYIKDGGDIDDKIRNILYKICELSFEAAEIGRSSDNRDIDDDRDINPGDEYFYGMTKEMLDEVEELVSYVINNNTRKIKHQDEELRNLLLELKGVIDNNKGLEEDFQEEKTNSKKINRKTDEYVISLDNPIYKKYYDYFNTALFRYIKINSDVNSAKALIDWLYNDSVFIERLKSRNKDLSIDEIVNYIIENYSSISKHIDTMKQDMNNIEPIEFCKKYNIK